MKDDPTPLPPKEQRGEIPREKRKETEQNETKQQGKGKEGRSEINTETGPFPLPLQATSPTSKILDGVLTGYFHIQSTIYNLLSTML